MDDEDNSDELDDDMLSSESLDLCSGEATQSSVRPTKVTSARDTPYDHRYRHRADVENLQARQYWRPEWHTDAVLTRPFNLGDASTLGAILLRFLLFEN